jgi:hypothetical protein
VVPRLNELQNAKWALILDMIELLIESWLCRYGDQVKVLILYSSG